MQCKKITSVKNKLKSRSGESLAETLIALLISSLALVLLAGVISASSRIVTRSRDSINNYYDACNDMVDLTTGTDGTVSITGTGISAPVNENVVYYEGTAGRRTVISYRLNRH